MNFQFMQRQSPIRTFWLHISSWNREVFVFSFVYSIVLLRREGGRMVVVGIRTVSSVDSINLEDDLLLSVQYIPYQSDAGRHHPLGR